MNFQFNDKTWGLLVIFAILFAVILLSKINESFISIQHPASTLQTHAQPPVNWGELASHQLNLLITEFGLPDLIDTNQNGLAIWKNNTLKQRGICWERITLNDSESHPIDLIYHFPLIQLQGQLGKEKVLEDICQFNEAIMFDHISQNINVKANYMGEAVALLSLAKRILTKEISVQQAHKILSDLTESVNPQSSHYDSNAYNRLKGELCTFQLQQNITN